MARQTENEEDINFMRTPMYVVNRLFICILVLFAWASHAQMPSVDPVPVKTDITEARLIGAMKSIEPGQQFWVALHLKIKDGWHTYWENPGDSGVPPSLKWTLPNGFKAGAIHYLPPSRHPYVGEINYGYDKETYFLVPITAPEALRANANYIAAVKASWLVCEEQCIPESAELSLVLRTNAASKSEAGEYFDLLAKLVSRLPKPVSDPVSFTVKDGNLSIALPDLLLKSPAKRAEFYPVQTGVIVNKSDQVLGGNLLTMQRGEEALAPKLEGILSIYDANDKRSDHRITLAYTESLGTGATATVPPAGSASGQSGKGETIGLWEAILFAFIGGLILNAMPCVFPVLSLKALSILRHAHGHEADVKRRGIAYTLGVVLSFVIVATLLILLQGSSVGWGTQYQSPLIVGIFVYFIFLIGLNLSGAFEIPMLFGDAGDSLTKGDSVKSSFFTGVLAVLVATPCTAPYMAAAVGYAFSQSAIIIIAIFTSMGLGMALPFLLISFFPRIASRLPKPGSWMETLRNALAFPMYLTVIWLLWVLGRQTDADMVMALILGLTLLVFTIWLWHVLSDKDVLIRIGIAIPLIILSLVPVGFLPAESMTHDPKTCMSPAAVHQGEPFSKARLDELRGQGKPIFVDATASWCITCQINERTTLNSKAVSDAFQEKGIAVLVADWTSRNEEITSYLESFGRRGVPLYVFYPAKGDPVVLPQLLTISTVIEAISK